MVWGSSAAHTVSCASSSTKDRNWTDRSSAGSLIGAGAAEGAAAAATGQAEEVLLEDEAQHQEDDDPPEAKSPSPTEAAKPPPEAPRRSSRLLLLPPGVQRIRDLQSVRSKIASAGNNPAVGPSYGVRASGSGPHSTRFSVIRSGVCSVPVVLLVPHSTSRSIRLIRQGVLLTAFTICCASSIAAQVNSPAGPVPVERLGRPRRRPRTRHGAAGIAVLRSSKDGTSKRGLPAGFRLSRDQRLLLPDRPRRGFLADGRRRLGEARAGDALPSGAGPQAERWTGPNWGPAPRRRRSPASRCPDADIPEAR